MTIYNSPSVFQDRAEAGNRLAEQLTDYKGKDVVVFAIPRGGIPVAMEVASALKALLDIVIVRKIPIPSQTEAGFGAITEDGTMVLNEPLLKRLGLEQREIEKQAEGVRNEIMRRSMLYRKKLSPSPVKGKTAIIIDDGLASGYTMIAAIKSLRNRKADKVIMASHMFRGAYDLVKPMADDLVCLTIARTDWFAVASYYRNGTTSTMKK
jgi:predicted phosphoribosyltransferase